MLNFHYNHNNKKKTTTEQPINTNLKMVDKISKLKEKHISKCKMKVKGKFVLQNLLINEIFCELAN